MPISLASGSSIVRLWERVRGEGNSGAHFKGEFLLDWEMRKHKIFKVLRLFGINVAEQIAVNNRFSLLVRNH